MDQGAVEESAIKMSWMYQKPGEHDVEINEPKMFNKSEGLSKKAFLNIVTILGSARGGKSTLMNSIVGKKIFATSDCLENCTEGVWVSGHHDNIADGAVIYVDTQGQDNDSLENDSKLLAPVVFLSKVIILNIMGAILQQQVLEKLKIFLHIYERIKHENTFTENNNLLKLGHLIITARDFSFKGTEKDVYDYLFKEETGSGKYVKERNDIRQKIRVVFGEPTVFLFRKSLVEIETNGDLKKQVDDLKIIIHKKVSKPREFCSNTCLKPDNVNEITKKIVDQLNATNEAFEFQSVVDFVQQREVDAAKDRFTSRLSEKIDKKILPDHNLERILTEERKPLIGQFDEETSRLNFALNHKMKVKKEVEEFSSMHATKERNKLLMDRISKAKLHFENDLEQVFVKISLPDKCEKIEKKLSQATDAALKIFDREIEDIDERSPYKMEVKCGLVDFSDQEKEKKISENNKRLEERKIIINEKEAFNHLLKKTITSINIPITNIGDCLQTMKNKLFETFDSKTQVVELELDYREKERNELRKHCSEEVIKMIKKNKNAEAEADKNAYDRGVIGGTVTGIGAGAAAGGGVLYVAAEVTGGVFFGAVGVGAGAGIVGGALVGFGIYKIGKWLF